MVMVQLIPILSLYNHNNDFQYKNDINQMIRMYYILQRLILMKLHSFLNILNRFDRLDSTLPFSSDIFDVLYDHI